MLSRIKYLRELDSWRNGIFTLMAVFETQVINKNRYCIPCFR